MQRYGSWFPTLIYSAPLLSKGEVFLREILKECHQIREFDQEGQRWSRTNYPGGYTSYGSLDRLHEFSSTFMDLERHVNRHVRLFAGRLDWDLGGRSLGMTDCWVNCMPQGTAHSLHLHPNSVISGTFYVATPKGCAGLKFEDPRLSRLMAAPPTASEARPENRRHITYPAQAGHLILFESWLRHEVPANPVRTERISVSFNYAWS